MQRLTRESSAGFGNRTWLAIALAGVGLVVYLGLTAKGGVPDPTDDGTRLSHGAVILNSGLLVMREGLEAVLVLAAVTASFMGNDTSKRRPVAAGAGLGLGASVVTWFVALWAVGELGGPGLDLQAGTGLLAVAVLVVVMNWFFHRVYWTGWIAHHHRRRRALLGRGGSALWSGLAALGFTAIYREGFEVVLFLQNLRLKYGSVTVLEGVAIGLAFTAAVAVLTFTAHHRLPYKRMLTLTGALIGFVLVVMVGESARELQQAGWISTTQLGVTFPGWVGTWFALFPTVQTLGAQLVAAATVIGSYLGAEYLRVRRPRRRGLSAASRPAAPPMS